LLFGGGRIQKIYALEKTPAATVLVMYYTFKTGYSLRYEVLTAVLPKIQVHWDGGP